MKTKRNNSTTIFEFEVRYAKAYKTYTIWRKEKLLFFEWWIPIKCCKSKKHALKNVSRFIKYGYKKERKRKNQELIC
jgi:hypothetical protein